MKKDNGITLVSLVLYVIIMAIVISVMSFIVTNFYNNMTAVEGNVSQVLKFNKFNNYLLREVKSHNNKVEKIEENSYILFSSGNSFSIQNNSIYYNDKKICDGVKNMTIKKGKDGDGVDDKIIYVTLNFDDYNKSMNYKIENIY